jgi:hypothetical protein
MRLRRVKTYAIGAGGMLVLVTAILLATGWGSAMAGQMISSVLVANTASNPVPVAGSVSVGNLPATQTVAGTVSVGNFPATQTVTGSVRSSDQTTLLGSNVAQGDPSSDVILLPQTDVSSARTVRLDIECFGSSACSTAHVTVEADGFVIDQFDIPGSTYASRTYDVPGTQLRVVASNTDQNTFVDTRLYGRSN